METGRLGELGRCSSRCRVAVAGEAESPGSVVAEGIAAAKGPWEMSSQGPFWACTGRCDAPDQQYAEPVDAQYKTTTTEPSRGQHAVVVAIAGQGCGCVASNVCAEPKNGSRRS